MSQEIESRSPQPLLTPRIAVAFLSIILGGPIELAVPQNAPSRDQMLTLTSAVDLALKQNLEIQNRQYRSSR